jgi:membrane-bound serine protease (ClpP class)
MTKKISSVILISLIAAMLVLGADGDSINTVDNINTAKGAPASTTTGIRKAFVIPVSGTVDHGMAAFIGRGLKEAQKDGGRSLIILDIDTFGGQLDAALDIVDSVSACTAPTIAFVRSKAISAGALIAFAADQIVMRSGTTIGDVAPIINTSDGPKTLGEKHQSPIRAKFRTLARKNGYPETLSEAMVTEEIAVYEVTLPDTVMYLDSMQIAGLDKQIKSKIQSQKQIVRKGELLTMTEAEAEKYGFSKMTVSSINEMLTAMGHTNVEIITIGKSWSEHLVSIIAMLAPVLMMLGFACLYIEMRSPGFGIPGIIGIACLAIVFFGQYMVGLANYTEALLIVAGIVLLAVEIFVLPGFGIAGFSGIALILVAMVLSFQSFVIPSPELPWQTEILKRNILRFSLSILGSITLIFIFFKYFLERLGKVIKGPYLAATLGNAQSTEGMDFVPKVGDRGIASTSLRPAGKVRIGNDLCDVVTDGGMFIDDGTEVVVLVVQGNRIVVGVA